MYYRISSNVIPGQRFAHHRQVTTSNQVNTSTKWDNSHRVKSCSDARVNS